MKNLLYYSVYLIPFITFSQELDSSKNTLENIDLKIENGDYEADTSFTADKLVLIDTNQNAHTFDENEWLQIKNQIIINKQRVTSSEKIHTSKKIDTVYLTIPRETNPTEISSW